MPWKRSSRPSFRVSPGLSLRDQRASLLARAKQLADKVDRMCEVVDKAVADKDSACSELYEVQEKLRALPEEPVPEPVKPCSEPGRAGTGRAKAPPCVCPVPGLRRLLRSQFDVQGRQPEPRPARKSVLTMLGAGPTTRRSRSRVPNLD
eukprot:4412344-Amphidinium_carterae.1